MGERENGELLLNGYGVRTLDDETICNSREALSAQQGEYTKRT